MEALEILPAMPEQRDLLRNLLSLYINYFTRWIDIDVNEEGLFEYGLFDRYWQEPTRYPYLFRVGGRWAGFSLVREMDRAEQAEYGLEDLGSVPSHAIAEFFILEKYRGRGIGKQAAYALFQRHPGRWYIHEIPENTPAQAFWRKIIGEYTDGRFQEINTPKTDGPVQLFITPWR